jgi:hypothetical protein
MAKQKSWQENSKEPNQIEKWRVKRRTNNCSISGVQTTKTRKGYAGAQYGEPVIPPSHGLQITRVIS